MQKRAGAFFYWMSARGIWSVLAIVVFAVTANTIINTHKIFVKPQTLYRYDQGGYFAYLPATFIYQDFSFSFFSEKGYITKEFLREHEGKVVNKYPVGPALLLAPFYAIGHWQAADGSFPRDGFSKPYKHWVLLGCIFYVAFAFFLLRSTLRRFFPDPVVALTLLGIGLGTNLLYYSTNEGLMSHAYSFFLFSLVLWASLRYWEQEDWRWMVLIGIGSGLILLTRLPNGLFLLVPALWGITNLKDLRERLVWIRRKPHHVLLALVLVIIAFSPQLIYWKGVLGAWWVHTYEGERFFFDQPLFDRILFSFRKGWLVYSPMMALALAGFFFLRKMARDAFLPVLVFFLCNLYVVSSWGVWWYGGSFGMRALIESSAPLALPLAAMVHWMHRTWAGKAVFIVVFSFLIGLNLFQTHQYSKGVLHHDGMSWKSYKAVWGVPHPAPDPAMRKRDKHLDFPHYGKANEDKSYRGSMR